MSTSLLYHGFGIQGYQYVRTIFEKSAIVFRIAQNTFCLKCPDCKCRAVKKRGTVVRRFRSIPIDQTPVFIELAIQRVECLKCKVVRQIKLGFAHRRRSYTETFAQPLNFTSQRKIPSTTTLKSIINLEVFFRSIILFLIDFFTKPCSNSVKNQPLVGHNGIQKNERLIDLRRSRP